MKDYEIVANLDVRLLQQRVNEYLELGYVLIGSPFTNLGGGFYQAVALPDPKGLNRCDQFNLSPLFGPDKEA